MKLKSILFSALIFCSNLFAEQAAMLSVATVLPVNASVEVDGFHYHLIDNSITIANLHAGYHTVTVMSQNTMQVLYNQTIDLRAGYHFDITINRFGTALQDERFIGKSNAYIHSIEAMSDDDFYAAKETVRREWSDETREAIAMQIVDANYVTSGQVKELMQLFSFERYKLQFAKYAYVNTIDKHNYYLVQDAFNFSSSKKELADFLREYR